VCWKCVRQAEQTVRSPKSRSMRLLGVLLCVVLWFLLLPVPRFVFAPYDAARLKMLARRIADADRVVGSQYDSKTTLTLTGSEARIIVQAVSSAVSRRPPWGLASSCSFIPRVTFYKGAKVLDYVSICGSEFVIHGGQPYQDDTGALDKLIAEPLDKAIYDSQSGALQDE